MTFPLWPPIISAYAGQVDLLLAFVLTVVTLLSVPVFVLLLYFAIRYRRGSPAHRLPRRSGNLRLELSWTLIPLALGVVIFVWATVLFFDYDRPPPDALEINVVAKQWMWKFQHPTGQREINELHVPVGRPVKITMISEDVIHSLFIPAFRAKADVLPGRYNTVWFEATRPGEYHLFCAEYCGTEHSLMGGTVYAMEPDAYEAWLAREPGAGAPGSGEAPSGEELFTALACTTCHQEGARARGPSLEGLFGSQVDLAGGGTVVADEAYLRESILDPGARVVEGYQPLMPTYQGQVSEDQLLQLIQYIKSLGESRP